MQADTAAVASTPASAGSLKRRTLRASGLTALSHVGSQALRLGSTLIMTRILVPEVFGIMAIAVAVHVIVALLSDIGLQQAVVQGQRGTQPEFLDTAWTMQAIRGGLIWGACCLGALALFAIGHAGWLPQRSIYSNPVLPGVIACISFASVFSGFASTKSMEASRDLRVGQPMLIELSSQLLGVVAMVALAWWTRSIWAVVFGSLLTSATSMLLTHAWLPGHSNRLRLDRDCMQEIISYGRWIFISSALSVFASNGDRLILGLWMSGTALGLYAIALNLVSAVEGLANKLFGSVSFAVFSEVSRNSPERLRELYFRVRLPADLVFLAAAGFMYAAGPAVVKLMYDVRYQDAGVMLQTLSFGLFFVRFNLCCNVFAAIGKPHYLSVVQLLTVLSLVLMVPLMYSLFDIRGALWAVALYRLPASLATIFLNLRRGLHSTAFEMAVLPAWGVGWLIGAGLARLL